MGGWRGPEVGKLGLGMYYAKLWAIKIFKLAEMKGHLQQTSFIQHHRDMLLSDIQCGHCKAQ